MVELIPKENRIVFETDQNINFKIRYDVLLICTGAEYTQSFWKNINKLDRDIYRAIYEQNVLVIGGGPTGIEAACIIAEMKQDSLNGTVGICTRNDRLLPTIQNGHETISDYLTDDLSIMVHVETEFEEEKTQYELGYECVLNCSGHSLDYTLPLLQCKSSRCRDHETGRLLVNQFGQLSNEEFLDQQVLRESSQASTTQSERSDCEAVTFENIFCFGDVCQTPTDHDKNIHVLYQYENQICNNVVQVLQSRLKRTSPSLV